MDTAGLLPVAPTSVMLDETPAPVDPALKSAIDAIAQGVAAILSREQVTQIHNHAAPITVNTPENRTEVTVQPAAPAEVRNEITVQPAAAAEVHLEAVINQPAVSSKTTTIERDAAHEAVRTTEHFEYREA